VSTSVTTASHKAGRTGAVYQGRGFQAFRPERLHKQISDLESSSTVDKTLGAGCFRALFQAATTNNATLNPKPNSHAQERKVGRLVT
jgi:hypothetical protein